MKLQVQSLALLSGLRVWHCRSCGVGHRCGLDLALLWLWCRPAATALIRPLAWQPPYAAGAALKRQNTVKKIKNKLKNERCDASKNPNFVWDCLIKANKKQQALLTITVYTVFLKMCMKS